LGSEPSEPAAPWLPASPERIAEAGELRREDFIEENVIRSGME